MTVRGVFFDVGETLMDETRLWAAWADWLGVSRFTFMAALGTLNERGEDHLNVFELFRPGIDVRVELQRRQEAGDPDVFTRADLYPDAVPCLQTLRSRGYVIGVAGQLGEEAGPVLEEAGCPIDVVASALTLGATKPSTEFFARLAAMASLEPAECAYVGDRIDNDVVPARTAGMMGGIHSARTLGNPSGETSGD